MKKLFFIILWFAGFVFVLPSCNSSKDKIPSGIMPEKKMQLVFTDALIAEGYIMENTVQQDTQKKLASKYYNEVFDRYHITKEEYYRSYNYYSEHPAIFEKLMGPIIDSLTAMEARMPVKPVKPIVVGGPGLPDSAHLVGNGRKMPNLNFVNKLRPPLRGPHQ